LVLSGTAKHVGEKAATVAEAAMSGVLITGGASPRVVWRNAVATFFHAEVLKRTYFSSHHLWAAEHYARLARDIEEAHTSSKPRFDIQHRAYVMNAVLSAVAFLEATINEVFDDAADKHSGYVDPVTAESRQAMADLWTDEFERKQATLEKYQVALQCSDGVAFDEGLPPYQAAALLIRLRNALTHARAETLPTGGVDKRKLSAALKGKFERSRLMQNDAGPHFPDRYLSAGCADWAVKAARAFADEFFNRLGLQPNYKRNHDFPAP
jgi:hypothetical protein